MSSFIGVAISVGIATLLPSVDYISRVDYNSGAGE
jgi:hypothetical protein